MQFLKSFNFFLLAMLAMSFSCHTSFGQIDSEEAQKVKGEATHEFLYNPVYTYIGTLELKYEYLLNEKSGAGMRYLYTFNHEFIELRQDISLFYRRYYGKKYAGGFYNEVFLSYNSVENTESFIQNEQLFDVNQLSHNVGIGFGLGTKLISKDGILLDLGVGIGYNFYRSDFNDRAIPRLITSFGFRF